MGRRVSNVHTHNRWGYSRGCRCETCRADWAGYRREQRAERYRVRDLVESAGDGRNLVLGITHGYGGFQNHACRCETCLSARAERDAARWAKGAVS